jgi:tripartite-type tricarboxylate transporter receptor subunit TctC
LSKEKKEGGDAMKKMRLKIVALCFLFLFLGSATGTAAGYPERPIKIIHPYSAGGGEEYLFRFLQPSLERELGQTLLLEFAGGAATKIGTNKAIKETPDGYTLLFTPLDTSVPRYYSGVFDVKPWEQLVPMGRIATNPWVVIEVLADGPYKTFADLVREGKKKGRLTGASTGAGGIVQAVYGEINRLTGLNIVQVPFTGSGETRIALLGGHVDMRVCQPGELAEMAGKTRGLAISSEKRLKALPGVPTMKEVGLWDGAIEMSDGFWGPLNLPPDVVNTFTKALEKATNDPAFIKLAEGFLFQVEYRSPERHLADIKRFDAAWGPLFREMFKKP